MGAWLNLAAVEAELRTDFVGRRLLYYTSTGSTQDVARAEGETGAVEGTAVLWMLAAPPVNASHYTYLAQGANAGEFGLNGTYTWAMKTWVLDSVARQRFCLAFSPA